MTSYHQNNNRTRAATATYHHPLDYLKRFKNVILYPEIVVGLWCCFKDKKFER